MIETPFDANVKPKYYFESRVKSTTIYLLPNVPHLIFYKNLNDKIEQNKVLQDLIPSFHIFRVKVTTYPFLLVYSDRFSLLIVVNLQFICIPKDLSSYSYFIIIECKELTNAISPGQNS